MKVTLDLFHVAACLCCAALGFGIHAFAAPPPMAPLPPPMAPPPPPADSSYPVTPTAPAVSRWDFKCVDHESVGIDQNWANQDLDKPTGWNPYLAKMTAQGWEPAVFIAPNAIIRAVCFRRPAVVRAAPASHGPPTAPPGPLGRCTGSQVLEMRASGMSESAITSACRQP